MKFKMAVEMEFEVPDVQTKKLKSDEFYKDLAKAIAEDTASIMAIVGIGVKYEDCSWLEENEKGYSNGVLYFGE